MPIVLREQKNMPLTSAEVDGNFKELAKRLEHLEQNRFPSESLASIEQEGSEIVMIGSLGTTYGRFQLPVIQWLARGDWEQEILYHPNDVVSFGSRSYVCTARHMSQDFQQDRESWMIAFEHQNPVKESNAHPEIQSTFKLPVLTRSTLEPAELGRIAIYTNGQSLELLIGDVQGWKKVDKIQEFNP